MGRFFMTPGFSEEDRRTNEETAHQLAQDFSLNDDRYRHVLANFICGHDFQVVKPFANRLTVLHEWILQGVIAADEQHKSQHAAEYIARQHLRQNRHQ